MKGIDISQHNGIINWDVAKAAGLDFVMIRCGIGGDQPGQDDIMFERNVAECVKRSIPYGIYLYSYALNLAASQSEILHVQRLIKGKTIACGVYIDMEDADDYKKNHGGIPSKQVNTDIVKAFCNAIPNSGYYCNKDWHSNYLIPSQLQGYKFWYARPGMATPDIVCDFWQSKIDANARWPGVAGPCDNDIGYNLFVNVGQPSAPKMNIYTVIVGDTLAGIAVNFKTTAATLSELNGLYDPDILHIGQVLRIARKIVRVQKGDTLASIAAITKTSVNTLATINNIKDINNLKIGQLLIIE
jgi:LysM repeat protein